jgi:hypothetical protein
MTQAEHEFYQGLRGNIAQHPEWMLTAMQAINSGLHERLAKEQHDASEWETIAIICSENQLFKNNKGFLAHKIAELKDSARCRWDHIIERLAK